MDVSVKEESKNLLLFSYIFGPDFNRSDESSLFSPLIEILISSMNTLIDTHK